MSVNEKIKQYLDEHGIKQAFLAKKTGISSDVISKIVLNQRNITAIELGKISKALNVSADIFLD